VIKKTKKNTPVVLRSELGLIGQKNPMPVVESYTTVKRRIRTAELFVEVTTKAKIKFLVNKTRIEYVAPDF